MGYGSFGHPATRHLICLCVAGRTAGSAASTASATVAAAVVVGVETPAGIDRLLSRFYLNHVRTLTLLFHSGRGHLLLMSSSGLGISSSAVGLLLARLDQGARLKSVILLECYNEFVCSHQVWIAN